jgi:hypothetical protein
LLNPIETYLLTLVSRDEYSSFSEVTEQTIIFFENIEKEKVFIYLEESIRFLAYSGVILIKLDSK